MPWDHCDVGFILDDEDCPSCGVSKAAWTVEVDKTRVFMISTKRLGAAAPATTFLDVQAEDERGAPLVGWSYRVRLADGTERAGILGEDARILIDPAPAGEAEVELAPPATAAWAPAASAPAVWDGVAAAPELAGATLAAAASPSPSPSPSRASAPEGAEELHAASYVDVQVVDARGEALAGWRYRLELADGTLHEGVLGAGAALRHEPAPEGEASLAVWAPDD